jgi:hypothetical protein
MGQKMTTVFYHISTWLDGILNFKDFFLMYSARAAPRYKVNM